MKIIIKNRNLSKEVTIVFEKDDISKDDVSRLEKLILENKDRTKRVVDFFIHIEMAAATAERIKIISEPQGQEVTL